MSAVTPRVTRAFFRSSILETKCWWAHKGRNTVVISMTYDDDGTVFNPSGTEKTEKIVPSVLLDFDHQLQGRLAGETVANSAFTQPKERLMSVREAWFGSMPTTLDLIM
jgi:hypothetical protein